MIQGIICVIAAAFGTFVGAILFYEYLKFFYNRRSKK